MGLTDILTTFKSFFSRSFWFGSFLPVAIFTGIHLVIAWWVGTGLELSTIISADTGKLITVPLALFALIVSRLRGDAVDSAGAGAARWVAAAPVRA